MKAPLILGGLLLFTGLLIALSGSHVQADSANLFGFTIIDQSDHVRQVMHAFWLGVALSLMLSGLAVLVFLLPSWKKSQSGNAV